MPIFKSKYGHVTYKVKQLPGCCGVAVVYHCRFHINGYSIFDSDVPRKKVLALYRDFNAFLHSYDITLFDRPMPRRRYTVRTALGDQLYPYDLYRSHIIMTDVAPDVSPFTEVASIYDFCKSMKWDNTKKFRNIKTDDFVYVFEKSISRESHI